MAPTDRISGPIAAGASRASGVGRWAVPALAALVILAYLGLVQGAPSTWETVRANLDTWQTWAGRNPVVAVLAFFLVYSVAAALPLPAVTALSVLAGALFGRPMGVVVASLAYTAGALAAFLVARSLLRDRVRRTAGPWLRRIERGMERDGASYLLSLRLMPSAPFFLVNVLMAITPIRARTFAAVSWVGALPTTFLYAGVGTELAAVTSPAGLISLPVLGALAALAVAPLVVRVVVRWRESVRQP